MLRLQILLLVCVMPVVAWASNIPKPVVPDGVGVNIHFVTGQERDLDLIAAAGFRFVRMDFHWEVTEPKAGEYKWAAYDELLRNLAKRNIGAILILDYSNPIYEKPVTAANPITGAPQGATASPQHPESIAAFARWAAAAAKHYQNERVIWEIWNEPNGGFWAPKPDAQQYTALALATSQAIRKAVPNATIVGPASAAFPWEFLEKFLSSGILTNLDGVSVHPYRSATTPPETALPDYRRLRAMIERHALSPEKANLPILSGEWGYSTHVNGVSLDTQAAYAARQQLANLSAGIPLSIWYDWKNDGPDPNENEHNFGVAQSDLEPKPAYAAIKTLTHELAGYTFLERVPLASEKDFALLFSSKNGRKLVAWTLGEPHSLQIPAPAPKPGHVISIVDSQGKKSVGKYGDGKATLDLTAAPQYYSITPVP